MFMNQSVIGIDFIDGSGDITFINQACNKKEDHIDRAAKNLKNLQLNTSIIRKQIEKLKQNPKEYLRPIRNDLVNRVNLIRQENQYLKKMVQKSKIPGFSEMTKKKIEVNHNERDSLKQSLRSSYQRREGFDEFDSVYDKNDAVSTCLNYALDKKQDRNRLVDSESDMIARNNLTQQIKLLLRKAEVFEEQLSKIDKQQTKQVQQSGRYDEKTKRQLKKIQEYKKKLIKLLSQLKNRESSIENMVKTYRRMHEQTIERLEEATRTLKVLTEAEVSPDIDQKYAEVLDLQERLKYINDQLQQLNQTKWLEEIERQLKSAVKRMGIDIPKSNNVRQSIDELCEILIQCHLSSKKDGQTKLNMLKQYYEQEKKNNNNYIMKLKNKQQTLGRKLISLQMEK